MSNPITDRKTSHLEVIRDRAVSFAPNVSGFADIKFENHSLPDFDFDAVDLRTQFLGHELRLPFLISAMTGGPDEAATINRNLAEAAARVGVAMAVGSQRAALKERRNGGLNRELRQTIGTQPLFANMGAGQLLDSHYIDLMREAVESIVANALIIHLNPLQESLQQNGDSAWSGIPARLEALVQSIGVPVIVKEVGFGISPVVARQLLSIGVSAIDVAGAGGTNWALVEGELNGDFTNSVAAAFGDWGIPTVKCLTSFAHAGLDRELPIIASGGISNGVDAAKAIRLGASVVGQAAPLLEAARTSADAVVHHLAVFERQLRIACFCTNSRSLSDLKNAILQ